MVRGPCRTRGVPIRALIQRVTAASVRVEGAAVASIGRGFMVLLGIRRGDTAAAAGALAARTAVFRIFPDEAGKMGRALGDVGGEVLVVSQMTLYGDTTKGRRPSFEAVAPGPESRPLYEAYVAALRATGLPVATGVFGAMMEVTLVNDGPVTFLLEEPAGQGPNGGSGVFDQP